MSDDADKSFKDELTKHGATWCNQLGTGFFVTGVFVPGYKAVTELNPLPPSPASPLADPVPFVLASLAFVVLGVSVHVVGIIHLALRFYRP